MASKEKDPLGPLETVVIAMLALLAALLLWISLSPFFGGHTSLGGVSTTEVCVTTAPGQLVPWGESDPSSGGEHPFGLRHGIVWGTDTIHVCDEHPSHATVALGMAGAIVRPLTALGSLLLLWRVIRRGRQDGLFSSALPGDIRRLAWFVLAASIAGWFWTARVDALLIKGMADDVHGTFAFAPDLPFAAVLIALGLITLARVMSHAVALREDAEATI